MFFPTGDMSPPPLWVLALAIVIGVTIIIYGGFWLGVTAIVAVTWLSAPRLLELWRSWRGRR